MIGGLTEGKSYYVIADATGKIKLAVDGGVGQGGDGD